MRIFWTDSKYKFNRAIIIRSLIHPLNILIGVGAMELFRPTGEEELALIAQSGYLEFPPRLPEQPIFYPVINEKYAIEIASKWNAKDGKKGYVLKFNIDGGYISKYEVQTVGADYHKEFWIPAEGLAEFNENIIGEISVVHEFG
ncbi:MAG: hypothetical protein LBV72_07155 [Tannerella sp.]|jgi:hypothetical protein|nr:hypothetical protein [Tannerella sp.]